MRISGTITKDGKLWLVHFPILDAMTQGRTKKEALKMAADIVESLVDQPGFKASAHPGKADSFELSVSDTSALIGLILKRQREASGLSLAQVAERMGAKSRNAYARYEQGKSVPSIKKLNQLLRIVSGGHDLVLKQSAA